MKRTALSLATVAVLAASAMVLQSQDAAPAAAPAPKPVAPIRPGPPLEMLKAIRDGNSRILEQQAAALQKLDEMEKNSQALKILGKRT